MMKLSDYLQLTYPAEVVKQDGGYFVSHPDLDGCMAQGSTADEALANLDVARELWIEARLEDGLPVPEPAAPEPSGRLLLRMPSWLHGRLVNLAHRQQVSLNLLITTALAEFVGGAPYRSEGDRLQSILAELEKAVNRVSHDLTFKVDPARAFSLVWSGWKLHRQGSSFPFGPLEPLENRQALEETPTTIMVTHEEDEEGVDFLRQVTFRGQSGAGRRT